MESELYICYCDWTTRRDFSILDDIKDIFKNIPKKLSKVKDCIQDLAKNSKVKINEWIELLKNSTIFNLFEKFYFNIKKVYNFIFENYTKYVKIIIDSISEYLAETKVGKWTTSELKKLDKWLSKHPKIKKISGVAVAALLIYINLNVTYTGDFNFDFDMSDIANALTGDYNLATIFGGASGFSFLLMFVTNSAGISFPWNTTAKFIGILGKTLIEMNKRNKHFKLFSELKLKCKTKNQRIAFNELLNSFNYAHTRVIKNRESSCSE